MNEIITSRQNPQIKAVCALEDKKERRRSGLFRFDGIKLFLDSLGRVEICGVYVRYPESDGVSSAIAKALREGYLREDNVKRVSSEVFEKLTEERSPEGIVTVAKMCSRLHVSVSEDTLHELSGKTLLLAESLRDPGNLGTVMRSCAALGVDCLIMTDDCADLYNPKTVRSAMGALFRLNTVTVAHADLPRFVVELRNSGRRVYAAALRSDARKIGELDLAEGDCFIIGNEGHGLSDEVIDSSTGSTIIPMVEGNESLNAAAAAAICIWETVKAQKKI